MTAKQKKELTKLKRKYNQAVKYLSVNRRKIHPALKKLARARLAEVKLQIEASSAK